MLAIFLLTGACALPFAFAHGYVNVVTIDGTSYAGNSPYNTAPAPSPIRWVNDVGPVTNTSSPDLACGLGAQKAPLVVPAMPGSEVLFHWVSGGGENWGHNVGPLLTYMVSCGTVTCDQFDIVGAKWFKIAQEGKEADGSWAMAKLNRGEAVRVTLPADVSPGGYLIRTENIALQGAQSPGGAEFFPSCTQVRVGGSGSGMPNETALFPGAYNATDHGILIDVYTDPHAPYTFPGPPVATFTATPAVSQSDTMPSPPASGCAVPRQVSRVMRPLND